MPDNEDESGEEGGGGGGGGGNDTGSLYCCQHRFCIKLQSSFFLSAKWTLVGLYYTFLLPVFLPFTTSHILGLLLPAISNPYFWHS